MIDMMLLTILIVGFGVLSFYIEMMLTLKLHDTVEDRVSTLIRGVVIDSLIVVFAVLFLGIGKFLVPILIVKYAIMSVVDFNQTLRQEL